MFDKRELNKNKDRSTCKHKTQVKEYLLVQLIQWSSEMFRIFIMTLFNGIYLETFSSNRQIYGGRDMPHVNGLNIPATYFSG